MFFDAAKASKVPFLLWSGLESMERASNGKYINVDVYESKEDILQYATKTLGLDVVNVEAGMYMSNFKTFGKPVKQADGSYAFFRPVNPESLVPLIDTDADYGLFVRKAIELPEEFRGKEIFTYGELISWKEFVRQLSESELKSSRPAASILTYSLCSF